ncbi:MAG: mechanosensitive ion channel family protein, partial [Acidimicrobiales bacterium]
AQAALWASVSVVYIITAVLVVRQLGVPLTSLVAPATVLGVGLGLGAQQIVSDLLAGFFLFAERQFGIGDLVRLSAPGQLTGISGTVEELTLRVTKLRSQQGDLIVVPNSSLRQVTNLSKDWSRVVLDLPIPVEEDLQKVTTIISDVATGMAGEDEWRDLILGPPVTAGVETIEVGYVNLRLLVRTQPGRQFDVGRELRLRVAMALRDNGISTPSVLNRTATA